MNFRKLRHRVILQQKTDGGQDDMGGIGEPTWTTFARVWASLEPYSADSRFRAQQVEESVSHKVVMRYRPDITNDIRLLYEDRIFTVHSVINVGELDKQLELLCSEEVV